MNRKRTLFALFVLLCIIGLVLTNFPMLFAHRKWGFIDNSGKLVIPCVFDDVAMDEYGGFEDPNASCFLPKPFRNFSEGLCAVRIGDKWGYIDKAGKVTIPAQFDSAGLFSEGLACVRKNKKVGYIDKTGKLVIPFALGWFPYWSDKDPLNPSLDFTKSMIQCFQFSDGLAEAFSGQNCGYIDKTGKFVIEPQWERCSQFRDGFGIVCKGVTLSYLDRTGKVIAQLPPQTCLCSDQIFVQALGQFKYVFIDKTGKRLFPQVFTDAHPFSEGLAAVAPSAVNDANQNKGWGYIDTSGKFAIPPGYHVSGNNVASAFIEGRAIVSQLIEDPSGTHNLHGVIDRTGKWIVPPRYDHIAAYRGGLARAFLRSKLVYLDKDGREVIHPQSAWGNTFSDGLAAVAQ